MLVLNKRKSSSFYKLSAVVGFLAQCSHNAFVYGTYPVFKEMIHTFGQILKAVLPTLPSDLAWFSDYCWQKFKKSEMEDGIHMK